jgi:hypothetical protein
MLCVVFKNSILLIFGYGFCPIKRLFTIKLFIEIIKLQADAASRLVEIYTLQCVTLSQFISSRDMTFI